MIQYVYVYCSTKYFRTKVHTTQINKHLSSYGSNNLLYLRTCTTTRTEVRKYESTLRVPSKIENLRTEVRRYGSTSGSMILPEVM